MVIACKKQVSKFAVRNFQRLVKIIYRSTIWYVVYSDQWKKVNIVEEEPEYHQPYLQISKKRKKLWNRCWHTFISGLLRKLSLVREFSSGSLKILVKNSKEEKHIKNGTERDHEVVCHCHPSTTYTILAVTNPCRWLYFTWEHCVSANSCFH